jgi:hypothetical protein
MEPPPPPEPATTPPEPGEPPLPVDDDPPLPGAPPLPPLGSLNWLLQAATSSSAAHRPKMTPEEKRLIFTFIKEIIG